MYKVIIESSEYEHHYRKRFATCGEANEYANAQIAKLSGEGEHGFNVQVVREVDDGK